MNKENFALKLVNEIILYYDARSKKHQNTSLVISRLVIPKMRNVSDKLIEKLKTHILCSITFFFKNRAVYEMIWKNIVERGRTKVTIWCMRIAWRIPKATNTHSEYVIIIAFLQQRWMHERASTLRSTHILYLLIICFQVAPEDRAH